MPEFAGTIKYPIGTDAHGGGNQMAWWKDIATTTQAEIAAQVAPAFWWRGLRSGNINDYINPSEQAARLSGLVGSPTASGFLTVRRIGDEVSFYVVQTWEEWPSGKIWFRTRLPDGTWQAWKEQHPASVGREGATEHLVRLSELRRRRGPVHVSTPAVVVLALDHGLTNFKSKILPLLQARGLTTTLAINSQNWADAQNSGATQADVKAWEAAGTVEVANHGRTHTYPTTDEAWATEIVGGREELETQLGIPVDTYQMAGSDWGSTISDLGRSGRGKIAMASHAIVTGMINDGSLRAYPLDGDPTVGSFGYWIDQGGTLIDTAKARIQDAITKRGTVIIRHHPQFMDETGYVTAAEFAAFLDHLVMLRDSGQITVLQQRDAMIATHAPGYDAMRVLSYDSGLRNVSALLTNGWTGTAYLQRTGGDVVLRLEGVTAPSSGTTVPFTFPTGFQPRGTTTAARGLVFTTAPVIRRYDVGGAGSAGAGVLTIRSHVAGEVLYGEVPFKTTQAPATTPPGIAA